VANQYLKLGAIDLTPFIDADNGISFPEPPKVVNRFKYIDAPGSKVVSWSYDNAVRQIKLILSANSSTALLTLIRSILIELEKETTTLYFRPQGATDSYQTTVYGSSTSMTRYDYFFVKANLTKMDLVLETEPFWQIPDSWETLHPDLVVLGDFEAGYGFAPFGWSSYGAGNPSERIQTSGAKYGDYCMKMTWVAQTAENGMQPQIQIPATNNFAVGDTLRLSGWIHTNGLSNIKVVLYVLFDNPGATRAYAANITANVADWTQYSVDVVVPTGATVVDVRWGMEPNPTNASGTAYFDRVKLINLTQNYWRFDDSPAQINLKDLTGDGDSFPLVRIWIKPRTGQGSVWKVGTRSVFNDAFQGVLNKSMTSSGVVTDVTCHSDDKVGYGVFGDTVVPNTGFVTVFDANPDYVSDRFGLETLKSVYHVYARLRSADTDPDGVTVRLQHHYNLDASNYLPSSAGKLLANTNEWQIVYLGQVGLPTPEGPVTDKMWDDYYLCLEAKGSALGAAGTFYTDYLLLMPDDRSYLEAAHVLVAAGRAVLIDSQTAKAYDVSNLGMNDGTAKPIVVGNFPDMGQQDAHVIIQSYAAETAVHGIDVMIKVARRFVGFKGVI